jgi:adenine nucleotide transporter 17
MATASTNQASPFVHAIGGSLGSALALLLFYPLERARIELQSQASRQSHQHPHPLQDHANEKRLLGSVEVEVEVDLDGASPSSEDHGVDAVSASSSWSPVHRETPRTPEMTASIDEMSPSWDMEISSTTNSKEEPSDKIAQTSVDQSSKSSLLRCLMHLHARGALYQGVTPVITTIFASQFVFFFLHAYIKNAMQQMPFFGGSTSNRPSASSKAILSLASSCVAGIGNVLMTNPLWVANIAIVTGEAKTSSLFKELESIFRARGLKHLWSGTGASILLVSNPVIQFFSYEQIKQARFSYAGQIDTAGSTVLPPMEAFVAGAIAKTIATVMTYPLQLTQTLLRLDASAYSGIMDCLVKLYRRAGYKEWYTGMRAKLLQTVLTAAFTFLTYEQILGAVQLALVRSAGIPQSSS